MPDGLHSDIPWAEHLEDLAPLVPPLSEAAEDLLPPRELRFRAMELTPFDAVRVVILGQDPYQRPPENAVGLAFSVSPEQTRVPPSLQSIFTALYNARLPKPPNGDLSGWAEQGVLLLNTALTVPSSGKAGAHVRDWRCFSEEVIRLLNDRREGLVFALWGVKARRFAHLIDHERHAVVTAPHPASRGASRTKFQAASTFRCIEDKLSGRPIDWSRPGRSAG